jgi:hypothetical protein
MSRRRLGWLIWLKRSVNHMMDVKRYFKVWDGMAN